MIPKLLNEVSEVYKFEIIDGSKIYPIATEEPEAPAAHRRLSGEESTEATNSSANENEQGTI